MSVRIHALGTGDAFGDGGRLQPCFALRTDDYLALLDCGATSLVAMKRSGIDPSDVDAVLISHFHTDHFGGVPLMILDGQFRKRTRPLVIAGPPGVEARMRLAMEDAFAGSSGTIQRFAIEYIEVGEGSADVGPLLVRGVGVRHTPGSAAIALRIEAEGRAVAYSGDTEWTDALRKVTDGADLFICESYSFAKRIPYHMDHATLVANATSLGARRVVLTHPGPEMLARAAESAWPLIGDGDALDV